MSERNQLGLRGRIMLLYRTVWTGVVVVQVNAVQDEVILDVRRTPQTDTTDSTLLPTVGRSRRRSALGQAANPPRMHNPYPRKRRHSR